MSRCTKVTLFGTLLWLIAIAMAGAQDIRNPILDADGRFWVYRNGKAGLVFIPYGWMPAEASKMMVLNPEWTENPHPDAPIAASGDNPGQPPSEEEMCLRVTVNWLSLSGVGLLSSPGQISGGGM